MQRRAVHWFPVILLILLAAFTYWLDTTVRASLPKYDGSQRHDPDYIVETFTATRLGLDGQPLSTLTAKSMVHYPDDDTTHLIEPNYTRIGRNAPSTHIRAKTGLVSKDSKDVYFTGDVYGTRDAYADHSLLTFTTEYLHLMPDNDTADTPKPVDIRDKTMHITGTGLQLDNKNRTIRLLSRARVRYEKNPH